MKLPSLALTATWISLLPIVLAVYLLQGRRFARPLLIALSIYALLEYWRRRTSSDSDSMTLDTAT